MEINLSADYVRLCFFIYLFLSYFRITSLNISIQQNTFLLPQLIMHTKNVSTTKLFWNLLYEDNAVTPPNPTDSE